MQGEARRNQPPATRIIRIGRIAQDKPPGTVSFDITLLFAVRQMPQRVRPSQDVTDLGALHNPSGANPARRPRPCPLSLSTLDGAGPPDLLLQKEHAIDKRLGR